VLCWSANYIGQTLICNQILCLNYVLFPTKGQEIVNATLMHTILIYLCKQWCCHPRSNWRVMGDGKWLSDICGQMWNQWQWNLFISDWQFFLIKFCMLFVYCHAFFHPHLFVNLNIAICTWALFGMGETPHCRGGSTNCNFSDLRTSSLIFWHWNMLLKLLWNNLHHHQGVARGALIRSACALVVQHKH